MLSLVHVVLPKHTVKSLRGVQTLSNKNRWEYAGAVDFVVDRKNNVVFQEPTYTTSKCKHSVNLEDVDEVWPNVISYHTHPAPPVTARPNAAIVTLPSKADLKAFIMGYPKMQSNLILDSDGFTVVDIHASARDMKLPVPSSVNLVMNNFRHEVTDYRLRDDACEGFEYFCTSIDEWKNQIKKLNHDMYNLFGISIRYVSYGDPVLLTIDGKHYRRKRSGNG